MVSLCKNFFNGAWRVLGVLVVLLVVALPARAELRIDITQGKVEPLPIAITNFVGVNPDEVRYGRDISSVVADDLGRSGLFRPIEQGAFIQTTIALQTLPRFGDWRDQFQRSRSPEARQLQDSHYR